MGTTQDQSLFAQLQRQELLRKLSTGLTWQHKLNGLHVTLNLSLIPGILPSWDYLDECLMELFPDYKLTGGLLTLDLKLKLPDSTEDSSNTSQ